MPHGPGEICQELAKNATEFMACEKNMAGNWWMGFAAIGVLVGLVGVGLLGFYCCSRRQERNAAHDAAATGLLSGGSATFAVPVNRSANDTRVVSIAPPGGPA